MEDLISYLVKILVDRPEQVQIRQINGQVSVIYEVHVAAEDMGKVIGREGRIANAIRTLAKAAAQKGSGARKKVQVEFISSPEETPPPQDVQTILQG